MIVAMLAATALLADAATAAQPNPAAETQSPAAATEPVKKKDSANVICKSEPVLGSRLPTRKCRTVEDAQREKQDAQSDLSRAQGAMANNPH